MKNIQDLYKNFTHKDWLSSNTIYLTKHGSHAYGTDTEKSDLDIRGICIPPKKYWIGILDNFGNAETKDPYDIVIFNISKFFKLALDFNPNALEILFTEPEDHLYITETAEKILSIKEKFISKKAKYTLKGYAKSQLKRIVSHRGWILNPPKKKPERKDFGLPDNHSLIPANQLLEIESAIHRTIDRWDPCFDDISSVDAINIKNSFTEIITEMKLNSEDFYMYAARSLGLNDNLTEAFKKERIYKNAIKHWQQYQEWKTNRNKDRFELEKKYFYDCKHGAHLVRLLKSCKELFETGNFVVKRHDAEELLAIRNGAWSYEKLIEWAKNTELEIDELEKTSSLPQEPDRIYLNNFLIEIVDSHLRSEKV